MYAFSLVFVTFFTVVGAAWEDAYTFSDAALVDWDILTWPTSPNMGYPHREYRTENDVLFADYDVNHTLTGYYVTAALGGIPAVLIQPNQAVQIEFDISAYHKDDEHKQGYGYTFTVWTWFGTRSDPVSPSFTFHTGMDPDAITAPSWQRGHPMFTTRVAQNYGTCFANLFERATYANPPCVYNPNLDNDPPAIDANYAHRSPKFRMTITLSATREAHIVIAQYPNETATETTRTVVDYTDTTVWRDFVPHESIQSSTGFAVGTVLTGIEMHNFRVRLPAATTTTTTTQPTTGTTNAVENPTTGEPTGSLSDVTKGTVSGTTGTSSVTSMPEQGEGDTDATESVDVDHNIPTRTADVIHTNDNTEPDDHLLVVVAFSVAGVCAMLALLVVCFSNVSRRGWMRLLGRNKKVAAVFKDVSSPSVSQTEMSTVNGDTNSYDSTLLVNNGTVAATGNGEYNNIGLSPKTNTMDQYENAADMLQQKRTSGTVVYDDNLLPTNIDD